MKEKILVTFWILQFISTFNLQSQTIEPDKIAVIVITDLYHPAQDPGDNFDLISAYALPQIDLKAVILDCTEPFRQPIAINPGEGLYPDDGGPREAGYIPVMQLNFIFDRNVPFAAGPFYKMVSETDKMLTIPRFQQQGIELLIQKLKNSSAPVQIVSFGSARVLAVAFNREPELFKLKVERIHLSAGASGPNFLEWNVALDHLAINCLLKSELPIALYPCAADTANGMGYGSYNYPFSYDEYNTFYKLTDLNFICKMDTMLQRYLAYSYKRACQDDFLRAMENDSIISEKPEQYQFEHYVWETAIWLNVAKMKLVADKNKQYRIIPESKSTNNLQVIPNQLRQCKVSLSKNGYTFTGTSEATNFSIIYRGNPYEYEKAMQQALPALYGSFKVNIKNNH